MNILVQSRIDLFTKRGGDTQQIEMVIPYLKEMGINVHISLNPQVDLKKFDIIHLNGLTRVHETYRQMKRAMYYNKPVVLTPMYNSREDLDFYIRNGNYQVIKKIYQCLPNYGYYQNLRSFIYSIPNKNFNDSLMQFLIGYENQQKFVLRNANMILPNSEMELNIIKKELKVTNLSYRIIHHGIEMDDEIFNVPVSLFKEKLDLKDFVICIGRIEPLKNQLKVIEALQNKNIPVVFVGKSSRQHRFYFENFKNKIDKNKNLYWIDNLNRKCLFSAIKLAHVVAQPSWVENCGLPGLEGGIMGANIVMTERGYTKWHFKSDVWYCNPNSVNSIRQGITNAINAPRGIKNFKERIIQEFTWEKVSEQLRTAYEFVLINN